MVFVWGRHRDVILTNFWLPGLGAVDLLDVCS